MWSTTEELFQLLDTGAGGAIETIKRRLKFRIRCVWYNKELSQLRHYLSQRYLLELLDIRPALYVKCTRAYLWTGLSGRQRLQAQLGFFDWLLMKASPEAICQFYRAKPVVISQILIHQRVVETQLMAARGLGREGELELWLSIDGTTLIRAAFSVLPTVLVGGRGAGYVMYVGAVKNAKNSAELIKDATKLLERTKPSVFLFSALQVLAEIWKLESVLAVSDASHVFAGYRNTLAKRVHRQYDTFFKELGAERQTDQQHWVLPLFWNPRPETEIESKKRSQYRRRIMLRHDFIENCRKNTVSLVFH